MKALHTRIAAVAILVVSLAVLVPATAVAETKTYQFTISGTEVSATSRRAALSERRPAARLAPGTPRSTTPRSAGVLARKSPSNPVAPSGWPWPRRNRPTW